MVDLILECVERRLPVKPSLMTYAVFMTTPIRPGGRLRQVLGTQTMVTQSSTIVRTPVQSARQPRSKVCSPVTVKEVLGSHREAK